MSPLLAKRAEPTHERRADPASVSGVVVAGVLASFVIPGPYDWGSMLIGVLMLILLVAFGEVPDRPREALAVAASGSFALVLAFGRLLDNKLNLSDWPRGGGARETLDKPTPDGGWETLTLWAGLTLVAFIILLLLRPVESGAGSKPAAGAGPKPAAGAGSKRAIGDR